MRLNVNLTYNTRQTRFIRQVYPRMTFCQANCSDFGNSAIRDAEPQNFLNFARCAYAVQPVAALQSEYSIWWRAIEENDVLAICEELGTGLVPFSPLGRGYLTGKVDENTTYADNDIRSKNPRFTQEAIKANRVVIELLEKIGGEKGATPAQIALAWLLAQKPWIVPIPGSRKLERLDENNGGVAIELTWNELDEIRQAMSQITVVGDRY